MRNIQGNPKYDTLNRTLQDTLNMDCSISSVADVQSFCSNLFCKVQHWVAKCPLCLYVVISSVKQLTASEYAFVAPTRICQSISKLIFVIRGTVLVNIDNELRSSSQLDADSIDKYLCANSWSPNCVTDGSYHGSNLSRIIAELRFQICETFLNSQPLWLRQSLLFLLSIGLTISFRALLWTAILWAFKCYEIFVSHYLRMQNCFSNNYWVDLSWVLL
jgi:hypothetical protein